MALLARQSQSPNSAWIEGTLGDPDELTESFPLRRFSPVISKCPPNRGMNLK
jgi:hypothetical protein